MESQESFIDKAIEMRYEFGSQVVIFVYCRFCGREFRWWISNFPIDKEEDKEQYRAYFPPQPGALNDISLPLPQLKD